MAKPFIKNNFPPRRRRPTRHKKAELPLNTELNSATLQHHQQHPSFQHFDNATPSEGQVLGESPDATGSRSRGFYFRTAPHGQNEIGEVDRYGDESVFPEPQTVENIRGQTRGGRDWADMAKLTGKECRCMKGGRTVVRRWRWELGASCEDDAGFGLLPAAERGAADDHVSRRKHAVRCNVPGIEYPATCSSGQ